MTKFEIIISKLATLEEQNLGQTKAIDTLNKKLTKHEQDSEPFRRMASNNRTKANTLFWLLSGVGCVLAYLIWGV